MMPIFKLTPAAERRLLAARETHDLQAERVAAQIVADVRRRGDRALFAWAHKLDHVRLAGRSLWISKTEMRAARGKASREFLRAVEHAARNIRRVAEKQLPRPWTLEVESGVRLALKVVPLDRVGCYIPGGRFSLVSTLLMTAVPAQVAGVREIVAVCPRPNAELLAAAGWLGIERLARVGGAQAIAALAYGTRSIPRVDKILGPGNRFVTAAKQLVSGDCGIDLPAGPTEAVVLAAQGNPEWIAADLIAQAEHAPDAAALLVTTSIELARAVRESARRQLERLPRQNPAWRALREASAILLAKDVSQAIAFVNRFAPEHLSLPDEADLPGKHGNVLDRVTASGTVFLGPWAAQPHGDYATGSNHVLPTGGWARARGGLSSADLVKCITVQQVSRRGSAALAPVVRALAQAEGLEAHARAAEGRK
jgi:histidinol dehydrogenase